MLHFEKRWVFAPGYPPVELGLDTGTARELIKSLKVKMAFAIEVDARGLESR